MFTPVPTTTTTPTTPTPTADPTVFNMLAAAHVTQLSFNGTSGVVVPSNGPTLSGQFSIELAFTMAVGKAGYLVSKCDNTGARYYAVYVSSSRVYFFYAVQGQPVSTNQFAVFTSPVDDGNPHHLLVAVNCTTVSLYVDYLPVGSAQLAGAVQDCGAASATCVLMLGARVGATSAAMTGSITMATTFTTQTLAWISTTAPTTTTTAVPPTTLGMCFLLQSYIR